MDFLKEIIGKEVGVFYVSDGDITLFFTDGSDMRIRNGNYAWRICKDENIILSSADFFAQFADSETAVFWPMQEETEPDTIDLDEYMEAKFEQLETHANLKTKECKELLESVRVVSFEVRKSHDVVVSFSNETTLEVYKMIVYKMIVHDTNNPNECNIINLASDKREKDTVIIL